MHAEKIPLACTRATHRLGVDVRIPPQIAPDTVFFANTREVTEGLRAPETALGFGIKVPVVFTESESSSSSTRARAGMAR